MFPALRKGQLGAKVDLKHAYFPILLSEKFARYKVKGPVRHPLSRRRIARQIMLSGNDDS